MKIRKIAVIALALLAPLSMQAQKKKVVVNRPPVVVVEEPQEDPRITEMREATQQIIFIDSVVVAKDDFLSIIRLNPESGKLDAYDQFFRSEGHPESYVYINEMGNKCYFSDENANSKMRLYTLDKLGEEWSDPLALKGIYDGISEANYPFMMTDGTTFYFAAKGKESIGGYDIFVTRASLPPHVIPTTAMPIPMSNCVDLPISAALPTPGGRARSANWPSSASKLLVSRVLPSNRSRLSILSSTIV